MDKREKVRTIDLQDKGDARGQLVVVESCVDVPFEIKRIFYIYGTERDVIRGQHANRKSKFVLINVAGTSVIKVKEINGSEQVYSLDRPNKGLYIPNMVWKEMYDFSNDSVLLCIASEHYDEDEYIRNYDDYQNLIEEMDL